MRLSLLFHNICMDIAAMWPGQGFAVGQPPGVAQGRKPARKKAASVAAAA